MSNNNANETKKPLQLDVKTPEKFEKLAASTLVTTQKLAKRINKLFSTAFVDYHGSVVYNTSGNGNVAPYQQFVVELHFKPLTAGSVSAGDDRVRAFKPISEVKGNDIVSGIQNIFNSLNTSARFQMTEDAAQILSEFMLPGTNIDPWKPSSYDHLKGEYQDNVLYGQSPVMVKITGLDLVALIRKIYGNKNESDKRVEYGVLPYGPVTPNMNNQMVQSAANWRVLIMQIDKDKTYDLASEFGIIPAGNGGSIVTGY